MGVWCVGVLGVWVCECVGVWVCGCVVVWVCVCRVRAVLSMFQGVVGERERERVGKSVT